MCSSEPWPTSHQPPDTLQRKPTTNQVYNWYTVLFRIIPLLFNHFAHGFNKFTWIRFTVCFIPSFNSFFLRHVLTIYFIPTLFSSSSGTFKKSHSKKKVNRNASLQYMRNQPELKEHLCFYCNQYCSSVSLCQCRSCILNGNNPAESSSTADHKMDSDSKPKAVYLRPFKLSNTNHKQSDSHLKYSTHGFR